MRTNLSHRPRRTPALLAAWLGAVSIFAAADPAAAEPRLRNLVFDPPAVSLAPGETKAIKVFGVYDDDSTRDLTGEVILETRDWRIVEVLGTSVRGAESGSTTVRAKHPPTGKDADDPLEVTVPEITGLVIQPAQISLAVGQSRSVRALATLEDGRSGIDVSNIVEWTASKKDVASVIAGIITGLRTGTTALEAKDRSSGTRSPKNSAFADVTNGDTGGGGEPGDPGPKIVEMDATPLESRLLPGESVEIRVSARFEDDSVRDVTSECTFESTRGSAAVVDPDGRVEARDAGQATIRITHSAGKGPRKDPEIWVGEIQQISLSPEQPELEPGETMLLRALATFDNGRTADVTETTSWSSGDAGVVAVSDLAGSRGRITGVAAGAAVVVARDRASGIESRREQGTVRVATSDGGSAPETPVEPRDVRGLVLEPSVLRLRPGESETIRPRAVMRDGSVRSIPASDVAFDPRDERVVVVEPDGTVVAVAGGETEIRAEYLPSRKRTKVPARVHVARLQSLRIHPATLGLSPGDEGELQALATFDDGSSGVDVTTAVSWTSSKPDVASVDESRRGTVSGVAEGVAEIRAEDPATRRRSDRSTGRVRVAEGLTPDPFEVVALAFEPEELLLVPGERTSFVTMGVRADGEEVVLDPGGLSFDSTNRSDIRTNRDGEVLARRGGRGEIEVEHRATGTVGFLPVTVRDVERIEISPSQVALRHGESADLRALAWFNDGTGPEDLTSQVRWRASERGVADVSREVPGRVTGGDGGVSLVEVQHRESRVRSDPSTGIVRVLGQIQRVIVEPERIALAVGATTTFRAFGVYEDGTTVSLDGEVVWSVSSAQASIDPAGRLTALDAGEVHVRAREVLSGVSSRDSGDDGTAVIGGGLAGIHVTDLSFIGQPVTVHLGPGEARAFRGLVRAAGSDDPVDMTSTLEWASSHPAIASVDGAGLVACQSQGTSRISARDAATGVTSTATLGDATVVCGGDVIGIRIQPATANVDYPNGRNMRAFRMLADGSEVEITSQAIWTSSHPNDLSIVESGEGAGRVTGLEDVIATVNASDPEFGISSADPGGTPSVVTVRKRRVDLRIFPVEPLPSSDGVLRGRVGEVMRLRSRVEFASGATQGSNVLHQWSSSNPSVVRMGDGSGEILVNHGEFLQPGTVTITARWPADEFSPELTDQVTVEVLP